MCKVNANVIMPKMRINWKTVTLNPQGSFRYTSAIFRMSVITNQHIYNLVLPYPGFEPGTYLVFQSARENIFFNQTIHLGLSLQVHLSFRSIVSRTHTFLPWRLRASAGRMTTPDSWVKERKVPIFVCLLLLISSHTFRNGWLESICFLPSLECLPRRCCKYAYLFRRKLEKFQDMNACYLLFALSWTFRRIFVEMEYIGDFLNFIYSLWNCVGSTF
jgi:hypothetical protein